MASVSIKSLRKFYGTHPVLHGVDVEITDGEFVILVGPSGCGKSTLLRMIAGLETISDGTLMIDDRIVNNVAAKERDIAMVFQTYALYPHMSVAENMGFSLKLAKCPRTEIDERVRQAADILALTALLERKPAQLSGGQRQRVAMGRAIVRNPKVFLFDEPLSNLDAKLRVQMRTEIKELHRRLGSTIVYVTHDQIEAMTMADRIVVMQGGYAQQIGRPLDIYDAPANTFVATFIGSPAMNLITGKIEASDAGGRLLCGGGASIVLNDPAIAGFAGRTLTLGVRPEHLQLSMLEDLTAFAAEVTAVEPTGAETFVVTKHGGQEITAVLRDRVPVEPGTQVELSIAKGKLHFFDAETGARLAA